MTARTKFELKGKVGDTEVWVGEHSSGGRDGKTLTFEVVIQKRHHQWCAWLGASNKGWDDPHLLNRHERRTPDQEVIHTLSQAIDAVSGEPKPGSCGWNVRVEGESSEDARNRLISVVLRIAETLQPFDPRECPDDSTTRTNAKPSKSISR